MLSGFARTRAAEPAPAYQWLHRSAGLPTLQAGVNSVALDNHGAAFLSGFFLGTIALGTNSLTSATTNFSIYYDTFVARCDEKGDYLWVRQISGLGLSGYTSIAPDTQDNAIVLGTFVGSISLGSVELIAGGSATESEQV